MTNPAATQNKEIDCLSPEAQRLAEARLAAKRAARAEARDIRMKELERQQKEVEERPEKDFTEKGSRGLPGLSAATLASLGGPSSRRGSAETATSIDTEASIREIKDSLAEVEEKYKRAMVSNAQLDNEKTNFMYQVDTLKEVLLELEEQLAESRRQYEEKSKELEREKHAHGLLRLQLADATAALKQREETLEKHGIILNSEVTTNGEASDTLNNVGCPGATKVTKEELNAIAATADGTLGRANEVEVKNEIVENVGKREILQNTEQEQREEDPIKDCVDTEVLPPGENAEDQKTAEDSAPSPGTLAEDTEEQVQSQTLESTSLLERTEQVGSDEVVGTPDGQSGAPLAPSRCLGEVDSGSPGPRLGEVSCDASDSKNQSEKPDEQQEQETPEFKTSVGEVGTAPRQESAPLPISEVERVTSTGSGDPSGRPTPGAAAAGLAGLGEQADTAASSPPGHSEDTASHEEECVVDVRVELDSSTGGGLEKDPASQGAAGSRTGKAGRGPLGMKEPSEESNDPPGEALDSSQKKTKNKKKKNKKKKSPAPVETPQEVRKELTFQNPALSVGKEGRQATPSDEKSGVDTQSEAAGNPGPEMEAGSREHVDGPEDPEIELAGQLDGEDSEGRAEAGAAAGDGAPLPFPGATAEASGTSAGGGELDEGVVTGDADDGAAPGSPAGDDEAAPDSPAVAECPTQTAREGLDSVGLGDHDAAPAGELGALDAESKEEARGRNEDKSKEDCTLS